VVTRIAEEKGPLFDRLIDAMLMRTILKPGYRSALFQSRSPIIERYPSHLKTCFFYICGEHEIARVEVPEWMIDDYPKTINHVASLLYDQMKKGHGYPLVLSEAHEQAVIKSADREFFYLLVQKLSFEQQRTFVHSQKSLKKRRMSV
jgi:hypothetical protein